MNTYDIAFEINSELFGGDEYVDEEDVIKVQKILEQRLKSSQVDTLVINPINEKYRNLDDIKSWLDTMKEVRESGYKDKINVFGFFNYPKGKKLQLTVEVQDPDLVNALLSSEWSDEGLMPGMSVTDVRFSDLEREGVVADWLRSRLTELEQKGL